MPIISVNIIKVIVFTMGTMCGGGIHEPRMESQMISVLLTSLSDSTGPKK
jgi:hypothetical protein